VILRTVISAAAVLFAIFAVVLTVCQPTAWPMLLGAIVTVAGCLFERRYHAAQQGFPAGGRFQPTGERFIDPETGRLTAAWLDPATGERRYVDEGQPPVPPA
jgi:hypothetical protein